MCDVISGLLVENTLHGLNHVIPLIAEDSELCFFVVELYLWLISH